MGKTINLKRTGITFIILSLIAFLVMTGSCTSRRSKLDSRNLIPEKELVSVLVDIHLTDGLLSIPKINVWASKLDSITTYYHVIEKHGYTKRMMDRTLNYYFVNNPKELSKIYDQVLGILSEMESRASSEASSELAHSSDIWPGKDYYTWPGISYSDTTLFDVTLTKAGIYSLAFTVTLFPDDQSLNPRPTIYSCAADSITNGKKSYLKSIPYIKDGMPHNYSFSLKVVNKPRHVRGWLYNYENKPGGLNKHVQIENISLSLTTATLTVQ
jgi:hypothetical protein